MSLHLVLFIAAFSVIASANDQKDSKPEAIDPCTPRLIAQVNSRLVPSEMHRLVDLEQTQRVFHALTQQEIQGGIEIYSRNIRIQKLLIEEFDKAAARTPVQLIVANWPGLPRLARIPNVLTRTVGANLFIRLPSIKRGFADRLLPRQDILNQMRAAAKKIGPTTAITEKSVATWVTDSERGSDLLIDLTNYTHAEFDMVINTIAKQLNVLAK